MKNRIAKRLLAGCLAAMLLFGDTAGVLASELSETEAGTELAEVQESTEGTEATTEVDGTETVETTENGELDDAMETDGTTESSEVAESTETSEEFETTEVTETVEESETELLETQVTEETQYMSTSQLPAVENLKLIEDDFSELLLEWNYSSWTEGITFKVYRMEADGENYAATETDWYSSGEYFWMYVDAPLNQTTGNNGVYTYKVVPVDSEGNEGQEVTVFNKGGSVGNDIVPGDTDVVDYTGICFVDEKGTAIDSLDLHVGEAKKIGLAFKQKESEELVKFVDLPQHTYIDFYEAGYQFDILWEIKKVEGELTSSNFYDSVDYSGEYVDWLPTKEIFDQKEAFFKANQMPEAGINYFVEVRVTGPQTYEEYYKLRLPINVVAAEEGATYDQPEEIVISDTKNKAYQAMRDLMVARDNDSMVVTPQGLFDNSSTETWFDIDQVFDMYKERNGMNPYEGDYLHFTMGDVNSIVYETSYYNSYYTTYKRKDYDLYQSATSFITTREQENEVDTYIDKLVNSETGALYKGKYDTDREKVKAIYDFVIGHVNPNVEGDRRTPIYHTAWHALFVPYGDYAGSGTCQAFALLFTRISREMGIPSKVIMGTDAANHTYNIVRVDGKWYYIDTNARIYLANATNFKRTDEQEHYKDQRYINNYLSLIEGSNYEYVAPGVVLVSNSENDIVERCESFEEAREYVFAQAEANADMEFILTVDEGNISGTSYMDFGDYASRVTIDLNGRTIIIDEYVNSAKIRAAKVRNGSINFEMASELTILQASDTVEVVTEFENIRFSVDGNNIANINIGDWTVANNLVMEDGVEFSGTFNRIDVCSNVKIRAELVAKYININPQDTQRVVIDGKITANSELGLLGNVEVKNVVSKASTRIMHGTKLTITEVLNLAGETTIWGGTPGEKTEVALVRRFDTEAATSPSEYATIAIQGNLDGADILEYCGPDAKIFEIVAKDYIGDVLQDNNAFDIGDEIGTLKNVTANGEELTSANVGEYISIEIKEGSTGFVDIDGNILSVVGLTVVVTGPTDEEKTFSSLKKAIDGLANVAGKAEGTYTFTFTENTALSANVTLPAYVKEAIFAVAAEENSLTDVEVDFKGYTLTSSGGITVDAGVHLVNSAATNGKLVSAKKTDITDYAIGLWEDVEGINLSAVNGVLMLVGDEGKNTISGDATAKDIIVWNTWEVEGAVTNSGLHNIGTFICDTFTQKSTNQTNLEKDSVLVINTKADIYNVTCVFADEGKNPAIYQMANATVSLNGKLVCNNGKLVYGVLAENDADVDGLYDTFKDLEAQQCLFTTNIKTFPVEGVELQQASATPRYTTLLQKGTKMVVVGEWIVVKTRGVDGTKDKEEVLKKFTNWKEASAYIATLSNSTMTYVVEITDNLVMDEVLTMPAKAAGIIFRGAGYEEGGKVTVTYANALKLVTDTTFENITLANLKSVNGKNLSLVDAELTVSGAVALTGTLFMENATLDSNSKINVVNVISNSAGNRILYGGNASSNILTITGTVTAGPDLTGDGAIDVTAKAIANGVAGYTEGITLMNAAKASATWFTADGAATYKSGKVIKYGSVEGTVALQLWDDSVGEYVELGEFVTFQQAIDEINQLADAKAEYRILLLENTGDATKAITTPTKAAHVTISGGDSVKTLTYKNSFALKSNVTLEKIALNPVAASNSIAGNKFDLELVESDIYVGGAVSNVRTLTLENATLIAAGDITATDVINPSGTAKIVATATLTRKNGVITKVAPKFTINGTAMIFGEGIEVVLSEKATADYVAIDFSKEEAANVCASGIPFVKASKLTSDSLVLSAENFAEGTMVTVVKSAGYLAGIVGNAGATLSYEDEDGNLIVSRMLHFADAITEINNLKTKRDYTITLYDAYTAPKAIAMPNKNYVSTLTIKGIGDYVELFHNGNITLTSPTIVGGVYFKKTGATENPAAITFSTGGYALTVAGKVYFNTPVNFNGGKKGTLDVTDEGQLFTITNDVEMPAELHEQFICGGVTNFAEVNVKTGQMLKISEYTVISGKTAKTTVATLDVTTLNNAGEVAVVGTKAGTVKLANVNLDDGCLISNGTLSATNMTLEGDANVVVDVAGAFSVTGKLISKTDKAVLYTRQNAKGVPNLTINGTVTLENPDNRIGVGVYAADGSGLVKLQSTPGAKSPNLTAQLLTAKTATADMFVPVNGNVGVDAYPVENGYFLQKSGTAICVYYADEVAVAVCEGNADTGDLETAEVLGYYASFKDAVTAIEAWKDKNAEYTIVLLEDVNTAVVPAGITLPTQAANVIITSRDEEMYDIFYTGNITLKAPTEFVKVCFNPMNTKKQGAASNFAAGNYDLTLRDVEVGSTSGMKINNITGSAKQVTTLAVEELVVYGGVTNSKELIIEKPVTINGAVKATTVTIENGTADKENELTVKGAFTTDNLVMQGFTVVDAASTLTIKDIFNETTENIGEGQTNTICYGKNSKGAPNLTVKGVVSGENAEKVIFNYNVSGATVANYTLAMQSGKYTLSDKQKLATVEKAALSEITFRLAGAELGDKLAVKANKGVYVVAENANGALLEISNASGVTTSNCLDYSQAVNEINNIADKTADYTIYVGITDADVTDTNLTDKNAVSAITMPKKNTAASVTVAADAKESMTYTGNIAYPGELIFENITLTPKGDSSILGTKNVSTVTLIDGTATFKNISNVKELTLDNADLLTNGTVAVTDVILSGVSRWDALAKTTVTNLDASQMSDGSYIASKQDAKTLVPMFTISGGVTVNALGTPVAWKVLTPAATVGNLTEVSQYKNTSLVVAPKEDADKFVAWPFRASNIGNEPEGITAETLTEYKTIKNEVVNGDKSEMVVRIIQTHDGVAGQAETYAKSFDEAVTIINNIGDMTASYRMELLQGSLLEPLKTTKNGTAYGKLTLPTKAADVTITGANEEATVVMLYTGTLAINCDTTFDNIALSEGTLKNGEFIKSHNITPSFKGAYELTFTDSVQTLWNQNDGAPLADIVLASASIAKGTLALEGVEAYVSGAFTVNDLEITGANYLTTAGKAAITNVLDGDKASNSDSLRFAQYFTKTTKATQKSATQLAINGEIEAVDVSLASYVYDFGEKSYHGVTTAEISNQKFATMPKASIDNVTLLSDADISNSGQNFMPVEEGNLYKQGSALYYTTEPLVVRVVAQDEEGNEVYVSDFLTWEEAVKEIDKRADKKADYQMILLESIEEPIKTLTLPAKADKVTVTSEAGEENYVLFTTNKITLKCNTDFENVGLSAVKKPKGSTEYSSIAYTIAGGNFELGLSDMQYEMDGYYSMPSTISGGAKGTLTVVLGSEDENSIFAVDKISGFGTVNVYNETEDDAIASEQVESVGVVTKGMSGIGTLNVYPGAIVVSDSGTITVKNANICGGAVIAKDITVSQTAKLESAILMAGSEAANDGKLKLKDIVVTGIYNEEYPCNYISAEQDKNGKSQITISGTVKAADDYVGLAGEPAIVVDLYYNNYSTHAKLCEGMILINATKADAEWFAPAYTTYDEEEGVIAGMGYEEDGYGLYNTKKEIVYGALAAEH